MPRSPVLILCSLMAALVLAAPASAATTFTVDSTADTADANAGNGICATAGNVCTLRAAIAEVNALGAGSGPFAINFSIQGSTIATTGAMATGKAVAIDGCGAAAGNDPCVGVRSSTATTILNLQGGGSVTGLAISSSGNASEGILGGGTLTVKRSWLGIGLDGLAGPMNAGVRVRGANSVVGGTTAQERNVIANNSAGIQVEGADDVVIRGNYLGTNKDGSAANQNGNPVSGNGTNIVVTRDPSSNVPDRTVIGGTLDGAAQGTAACDGACNLIARASSIGVDLDTAAGPAGQTTIAGNYVGLSLDGTAALANAGTAIDVGEATPVTVGGPGDGDRNVLAGGGTTFFGVLSGNNAGTLTVRNNFLGMNAAGTAALPFVNNSAIMRGTANETLRDNRIAHNASSGSAVEISGLGVQVSGNVIGIGTGGQNLSMGGAMRVSGNNNVITGNTIGNVTITGGINVDAGDGNTIKGNRFGVDADGTARPVINGVVVRTFNADPATNNVIGGETAADENVISNATKDGVVIIGAGTGNAVLRNRGTSNAEQFIDVGGAGVTGDGPGNTNGDNGNSQPPVFTGTPTTLSASGTAAANATVRVFVTSAADSTEPGSITAYVGKATASGSGNWSLTYDAPLPNGSRITAGSTQVGGSSGELAKAKAVADATPPDTTIDDGPTGATSDATPTWAFSSEAGATFECRVDGGAFAACSSPFTPAALSDGQHTFEVRAIDSSPSANADPTPAARTITVDATAPDSAFTSGPSGLTADASPAFGLSADDPAASFECRVDGGAFAPCSSPYAPGTLGDGGHTVEARAIDALGNVEGSPATRTFTVDTTAPNTTIASGPSGPTRDATPSFGFTTNDPGAALECRVDGGAFAPCGAAFTAASLGDGPHSVQVRARDAAGNVDGSPATRAFLVDTRGPAVVIGGGKLRPSKKGVLKLTVSCPASELTGPCAGTLKLASAGKLKVGKKRVVVTFGSSKVSVPRGAKRSVTITLSKANRALLARLKTIKATATLPAKDALGNARTAKAAPTLVW